MRELARRVVAGVAVVAVALTAPGSTLAAVRPAAPRPAPAESAPAVGVWTQLTSPPAGFADHGRFTKLHDGRLFLANNTHAPAVYDPATDSWTPTPTPPWDLGVYPDGPPVVTLSSGKVLLPANGVL